MLWSKIVNNEFILRMSATSQCKFHFISSFCLHHWRACGEQVAFRGCWSSWSHMCKTGSSSPSWWRCLRLCIGIAQAVYEYAGACSTAHRDRTHSTWAGTFSGCGSLRRTVELVGLLFPCGYISDRSVREENKKLTIIMNHNLNKWLKWSKIKM